MHSLTYTVSLRSKCTFLAQFTCGFDCLDSKKTSRHMRRGELFEGLNYSREYRNKFTNILANDLRNFAKVLSKEDETRANERQI